MCLFGSGETPWLWHVTLRKCICRCRLKREIVPTFNYYGGTSILAVNLMSEFSRVVFGKSSAPMEAQFVAQENARRHQDVYPLAAETVLKST